jgi:hypothetical protein
MQLNINDRFFNQSNKSDVNKAILKKEVSEVAVMLGIQQDNIVEDQDNADFYNMVDDLLLNNSERDE